MPQELDRFLNDIDARIAALEREHGTAESCGEHEGLTYQYDMEVAAAIHELKWARAAAASSPPPTEENELLRRVLTSLRFWHRELPDSPKSFYAHIGTLLSDLKDIPAASSRGEREAQLEKDMDGAYKADHDRIFKAADGSMMCEAHPGREWPHDECPGPGMPWVVSGRTLIEEMLAEARAAAPGERPTPPSASPEMPTRDLNPPCSKCGGPHPFDTTVPSVVWNGVIRQAELPDYLCAACIIRAFLDEGRSFTAVIDEIPIEVRIDSMDAWDAKLLSEENTTLRARVRELEIQNRAAPPSAGMTPRVLEQLWVEAPERAKSFAPRKWREEQAYLTGWRDVLHLLAVRESVPSVPAEKPTKENA